jgi:hypothetical protein
LRAGPLVIPKQRRPDDLVSGIEEDRAVHLARQANPRHHAALRADGAGYLAQHQVS